jgi:hypothetical protein
MLEEENKFIPFVILHGAGAVLLDMIEVLSFPSIVTFLFRSLAVILRDMTEEAIIRLLRVLWLPKIVVISLCCLLIQDTLSGALFDA